MPSGFVPSFSPQLLLCHSVRGLSKHTSANHMKIKRKLYTILLPLLDLSCYLTSCMCFYRFNSLVVTGIRGQKVEEWKLNTACTGANVYGDEENTVENQEALKFFDFIYMKLQWVFIYHKGMLYHNHILV